MSMQPRYAVLEKDKTLANSATTIVDLDVADPITDILIQIKMTNGATSCQNKRICDDVSKIEVVDGSEVLFSMSMIEAKALNFYQDKKLPWHLWDEGAAFVQYDTCWIHFGKAPYHKGMMVSPAKHRNLQLKITHAFTISATAGFATGTGRLTVIALLDHMHGGGGIFGYLMAKNIYSWTTAASGDEVVELPTDYEHLMFMIRAFETIVGMDESFTNLKISADKDKFIPLDIPTFSLVALNQLLFPEAVIAQRLLQTDADTFESRLGYPQDWRAGAGADLDLATIDAEDDGNLTLQLITVAVTPTIAKATADHAVSVVARGLAPFNTLCIPWDPLFRPGGVLPAHTYKSLEAKITQGNAGAAASIVTVQERKY